MSAAPDSPAGRRAPASAAGLGAGAQAWAREVGAAVFAACAVAFWWLEAPYFGLQHDALYYAAEALQRLQPGLLARDLFFAHGSQGDYSLFIPPYAALVRALGLPWAALLLTAVARGLWLAGLWALSGALAGRGRTAWLIAGAVCLMPRYYEPVGIFSMAEPFATPRPVAEALTFWALAAVLRGRPWVAATLAVLAAALHPLMGWPAVALVLLALLARRPEGGLHGGRLLVLALAVGALLWLAALAGLPVAERLLQRYDPDWWSLVLQRNASTVLQSWGEDRWVSPVCSLLLLALAARGLPPRQAWLPAAVAALSTLVLLVWGVACAAHGVLVVQLQPWRVLWLVQVLAPAAWLLRLAPRGLRTPGDQTLALLVVAALLAQNGAALALTLLVLLREFRPQSVDARLAPARQRALAGLLCAVVLFFNLGTLWQSGEVGLWMNPAPWPRLSTLAQVPAARGLVCLGLAVAAAWWAGRGTGVRWPVPVVRAAVVAWAALWFAAWAVPAVQQAEPVAPGVLALRGVIPPGATVYWGDRPARELWLQLQRPAYAVGEQGASLLFSRPMALEWWRRVRHLKDAGLPTPRLPGEVERPARTVAMDADRLRRLCADPQLDVVVVAGRQAGADRVVAVPASPPQSVFDCRPRRALPGAPGPTLSSP